MNKRIQELAEQAEQELANRPKGMFSMPIIITKEKFNEKFAELIVKECIVMADEFELDVNRSGLVDRMKKHFGVK